MSKNILKLLNIIIFLFFFVAPVSASEWYAKAAKLHKEWAKTYHKVSDLERYTNIHKQVIKILNSYLIHYILHTLFYK